jgi:transposase, IS5 family
MVYYIPKNQVKIEDFELPMPGRMKPDNRWVSYAKMIPWVELGEIYVSSMNQKKGRKGIHSRLAIGALLVKHLLNTSDEDSLRAMEENVYI